ncbi:MAG: hypothetical protein ACRDQU_03820 [Pseudonocardiaceae bacterium]
MQVLPVVGLLATLRRLPPRLPPQAAGGVANGGVTHRLAPTVAEPAGSR